MSPEEPHPAPYRTRLPAAPALGRARLGAALDYTPEIESPRWRRFTGSIFHYRWMVAGIIIACTIAGALVAHFTTPRYVATASIILDRPPRRLTQVKPSAEYVSYDADRATQTQLSILTSRAVARQTIRQMHLETRDPRIHRVLAQIDANLAKQHTRLAPGPRMQIATGIFLSQLQAKPQKLSSTIHVQYTSRDPALAAAVVNQVISNYIHYTLSSHAAVGRRLDHWLSSRLQGVRTRLQQDNAALVALQKRRGFVPLPAQGGTRDVSLERLDLVNHQLAEAQAAAILAQAMQTAYTGDVATIPANLRTPAIDAAVQNLQTARQQYDALAAAYQPGFAPVQVAHDRVVRAQGRVHALSAELARSLAQSVAAARQRVTALTAALAQARRQAAGESGVALQYALLRARATRDGALYAALEQKMSDAGLRASVPAINVRRLDAAQPPLAPATPNRPLDVAVAFVLGVILAILAALARGKLNGAVLGGEEMQAAGMPPPLGAIPQHARLPAEALLPSHPLAGPGPPSLAAPAVQVRDCYARLAANVMARAGAPPNSLLVTSPNPGDGKTRTVCHLAEAIAAAGWQVLLVDGDLRRPGCHRFFGVGNEAGLLALQRGELSPPLSLAPCLDLIPCEREADAVLQPRRLRELLRLWHGRYDYVLVDSPPGNLTGDAVLWAGLLHDALIVLRWGHTSVQDWRVLEQDLAHTSATVLGTVLNRTDPRAPEFRYVHRQRAYYAAAAE